MEAIDRLLEQQPDVLVVGGALRLRHAAQRAPRVPIVATDLESDPLRSGLVQSLSRPGGMITGLWLDMPEMVGKLIELLKDVTPDLSRCAVLWDERLGRAQFEATEAAARSVAVAIEPLAFDEAREVELLVAAAMAPALIVLTSPSIFPHRAKIAAAASARRMPSISIFLDYARAGGLMAYGPSLSGMWRRAARHVDAVLRGRPPAELPIERPTRFELLLNQHTANGLGVTFTPSLLARADEVIE
jgi:putative ABC transport system substrate-binding protein